MDSDELMLVIGRNWVNIVIVARFVRRVTDSSAMSVLMC